MQCQDVLFDFCCLSLREAFYFYLDPSELRMLNWMQRAVVGKLRKITEIASRANSHCGILLLIMVMELFITKYCSLIVVADKTFKCYRGR